MQIIFLMRYAVAGTAGASGYSAFPPAFVFGAGVWLCSIAFTYLYNGVTDVREDRANGSGRPIARGALPVTVARAAAWTLAATALTGGILLGPAMFVVTLGMLLLGYAYSAPALALKSRTPATIAVVVASGFLTYAAGALCGAVPLTVELLVFAVAMTLWMGMVGAIAKDFSDDVGDAKHGRRNWTILWGRTVTACIVSLSALGIGAGVLVSAVELDAPALLVPGFVVLGGALVLSAAALTARAGDTRSRRRRPYRIFMITQYTAHCVVLAQPVV
ncbi:UbiA family prenyltransferase [Streptomyces sp. ADMS]|uniref:UbiA family prenyltransferase n=1 Tax=Streptomyces sp. ADMS TaxID=3071415 RepID=UPI00296F970F|nr:UbiA family prenyltransferase [Streptomyces sp. ADMS]MDW4905784.1 UbiA family prenyltransferase [Streptomyces sp. ADMS]